MCCLLHNVEAADKANDGIVQPLTTIDVTHVRCLIAATKRRPSTTDPWRPRKITRPVDLTHPKEGGHRRHPNLRNSAGWIRVYMLTRAVSCHREACFDVGGGPGRREECRRVHSGVVRKSASRSVWDISDATPGSCGVSR